MAPHSSILAWKIPWMEEPCRLQSMGSRRVGHNWVTSLSLFTFMHWRRKWQPTPVFLPGESQGRGSLMGCRLWGRTESDTTEATQQQQQCQTWSSQETLVFYRGQSEKFQTEFLIVRKCYGEGIQTSCVYVVILCSCQLTYIMLGIPIQRKFFLKSLQNS